MKRSDRSPWIGAESRLLSEFLAARFAGKRIIEHVRVGQIPADLNTVDLSAGELRMLGVWRRWVDAVVFDPPNVLLVEAAVRPDPGDVSQLELYLRLFPMTPELAEYATWNIQGMLVYAIDDPVIREMAAERGYTVQLYRPPWVDEYLTSLYARARRAPLPQA